MHTRISVAALAVLPVVVGCGSSWDIRKGEKLEVGCAESFFYQDADGDKWGDPNSEPVRLCSADVDAGYTASNGRDCDDGDEFITGLVNSECPQGLVPAVDGVEPPIGGAVFGDSEFAFVHGEAAVVRHTMATLACKRWGSVDDSVDPPVEEGHLATFANLAGVQAVTDALEATLEPGTVDALFVGIEWDGPAVDNGQWSWVDDSDDAVITQAFSWCGGVEPSPVDFFPLMNPLDPDHVPAMVEQLPELRLAYVRQEDGQWCLGLPLDAGGDPRFTTSDAHLLCERPTPDPADYRHVVGADG